MSEKILTSPNGQRVSVDLETGDVKPLPRIPVTAGASGGRSPGGLSLGPGSIDQEPNDEPQYGNATDVSRIAADVAEPFKAAGRSVLRANNVAANAIVHPVDTAKAVAANPKAYAREALRGVNSNIPGANTAVEAIGGPPAESPEDQAAAPGVSDLTGLAAAPLVGGVVGDVAGAVARPIGEAAKARIDARLPTSITGETRTKAAKAVIGSAGNGLDDSGGKLLETLNAHPELKDVLTSESDAGKRAHAVGATKAKLNVETAKDFAAVDAHNGGFEADEVIANLKNLAKNSTSPATQDAATNIAADIERRYGASGKIPALKLRDYRNELGEFAFKTPPASPAAIPSREAALRQAHGAINDAIEDTMHTTPGVDVPSFKYRNRQVSTLIPIETSLREQAAKEAGNAPGGIVGLVRAAVHPKETAVHVAEGAVSGIDTHLAKLAGNSGPAGVAALKAVALNPSRSTLQAAIQAGVTPQVALQVARLGAQQAGVQ